jgi:galactokinase
MNLPANIVEKYKELFFEKPILFRSPGRINLIGEHTDYNLGFVLPAAIDKAIYFAVNKRNDDKCKIFSLDMNDSYEFSLNDIHKSGKHWPDYLIGTVEQILNKGKKISGFNCVFGGDIPIGAGLSSSAALEGGIAFALNKIFKLEISRIDLVKLAQKAENDFVGVQCGIMDQYINIFGKSENALRIDCRTLDYKYFPFEFKNVSIVLFNSNVSHMLASSEYNQRRKECNSGVEIIKREFNTIESLRDVSVDLLSKFKSRMETKIYQRCKYVVEENERVLKACEALDIRDLKTFGSLMYQTHEGLSKDYEVSCRELDFLVSLTKDNPAVYGARMMGGGFGGCTINLIENAQIEAVSNYVIESYKKEFNIEAKIYITKIGSGTNIISLKENAAV